MTADPGAELQRTRGDAPTDSAPLPALRLEGHVRDRDGRPINATEVVCRVSVDRARWSTTGNTDDAGFYRLDLTPWREGLHLEHPQHTPWLDAWAPGFLPLRYQRVHLPESLDGPMQVIVEDLVLETGGSVFGVVRGPAAQPLDGVEVELMRDGQQLVSIYTDESGRYRLPVAADVAVDLIAGDGRFGVAVVANLRLRRDEDHREDLQLTARSALRAQFVYPDGQPVEGLRVMALAVDRTDGRIDREGAGRALQWTGADGRFAGDGVRPGSYRLFLSQLLTHLEPTADEQRMLAFTLATDQPEVRFVLPCHRLRVQVFDLQQRLVPSGQLHWMGWRPECASQLIALTRGEPLDNTAWKHCVINHAGEEHECFVPPGLWWWLETELADQYAWTIVPAPDGANETTVRLQMQPPPQLSTSVDVTIADEAGAALPGFDVSLYAPRPNRSYSQSVRDGRRTLHLPASPGHYELWVHGQPPTVFADTHLDVTLSAGVNQALTLVVPKGGFLELVLHLPDRADGDEVSGASVTIDGPEQATVGHFWRPHAGGGFDQVRPHNGKAVLLPRLLHAGRYQVSVRLAGYQDFAAAADVKGGATTRIEVSLQR